MVIPTADDWQAFAGVVVVVVFLAAGYGAVRRFLSSRTASPQKQPEDLGAAIRRIEKELADIRLCMAEKYVRRDDYVVGESRVIGLLENHSLVLTRLEERVRKE